MSSSEKCYADANQKMPRIKNESNKIFAECQTNEVDDKSRRKSHLAYAQVCGEGYTGESRW